jgi:uncharacterized protein YjiS (DUF1127 family)
MTTPMRIATFLRKLVEKRRARRACGGLEDMSDRDLRDIGLRRVDVVFAWRRKHLWSGNLVGFEGE